MEGYGALDKEGTDEDSAGVGVEVVGGNMLKNWSSIIVRMDKNPRKREIFELEQKINYGLLKDKINAENFLKYFSEIFVDKKRKDYINFLIHG